MKPIEFPGSNVVLGKDQPEYQPLPALVVGDPEGTVISCWELSQEDIDRLDDTRQLWLSQLTFGAALQPQLPSVDPLTTNPIGPATQHMVDNSAPDPDNEVMDLYRMDCRVGIRYGSPLHLVDDVLLHALRAMLAQDRKATGDAIPPAGSVITIMMSIDRSGCAEVAEPRILLPGLGGRA